MSPSQCRTARAILGITVEELAGMAGVSPDDVKKLETEAGALALESIGQSGQSESAQVQAAFEARGISFTYADRPGVRFMTLDGIIEVSAPPAKLQ